MLLQLVHDAFLGLFALRDQDVDRGLPDERRVIYDRVGDDCVVLLRHVLPLLQTAADLVDPVLRDLDAWLQEPQDRSLEPVLSSFVSSLVQPKRLLWAQHCVKALALILSPSR
ncbi:hypothetical protein P43SY_010885 [Pythium insidiosum]|uniref:Uncharacterized protein n=1 Tax=Pythium insidiosum TaxID=114742 RepID=A0AAD5LP68_PYTIN|nr:hypothetical protein P43SY_010885 [Pythium insidiosum]